MLDEELENLNGNDPFLDPCIFSLLPKTLVGLLPKAMKLAQQGSDPVQNLLKSMVLNNPVELLEQATKVLNSNPELLKSDFACELPSQGGNRAAIANGEDQLQRRRPALRRKRAQFSFKPGQSEPSSQADPSLNIDNLQDPDEFFAAFENAEKDSKKSRGETSTVPIHHAKSDFACQLPSRVSDRDAIANDEGQPPRRRPALGRKRAQFSFKAGQSEPTSQAEPSFNIDNLQDPNEFFAAFEMRENAKKELKKLRGETSTEPIHHHNSTATRPRRPGILGKRFTYKHLYPAPADNMENLALSQEIFKVKSPPPSKATPDMLLEATDGFGASKEKENTGGEFLAVSQGKGSLTEMENRIGSILDELMYTCRDLGGDETATLLQEKLNIKPLILDKLSLPDLSSVQINDRKPSNPRCRKSFSVLQQSIKAMVSRKTPVKGPRRVESPTFSKTSRSPSSLMPTLQRRISQLDPTRDPFSMPLDFDMSPVENTTVVEGVGHSLSPPIDITGLSTNDHATSEKIDLQRSSFSGKLPAPMLEGDNSFENNINSPKLLTEESAFPFEKPLSDNSYRFDSDMDVTPNGLDTSLQDKEKNMLPEPSASQEPDLLLESPTIQTAHSSGNQSDHASPTAETVPPMGGHSENPSILSEQNNEELQEPASILPNRRKEPKTATRRGRKKAELSRRQSLAGAGTSWKSGVRRSNRIKTRPLEYWRGERFLFGRIHDSLPTVIGVKCSSPSNKEPVLKVKSFVDKKYAELIEIAALH
ncbi:centromere protein C-like isoform X2 [Tasmannia lanceolata]|uniref:centromere protein C-like isoform X2 n=1 Tax=Tasmannia lanceolata TaxID=3420 RepID=UPI004063080D